MITLQQFKDATGINNKDTQVNALIPIVEEHIKSYCNITEVPAEYDLNAIKMVQFHLESKPSLDSQSISRLSQSFNNEYPSYCTQGLRRKLRW